MSNFLIIVARLDSAVIFACFTDYKNIPVYPYVHTMYNSNSDMTIANQMKALNYSSWVTFEVGHKNATLDCETNNKLAQR